MRCGVVDIGTNSTRLLVADVEGDRLTWVDRRLAVTGLGHGIDATGVISDEAAGRTLDVLAGYGLALAEAGVDVVRAVATSAGRDAANRDDFLNQAAGALGVAPTTITGEEEGGLAFLGATRGRSAGGPPFLVVDIGGGSTEFVFGETEPVYRLSVQMGSVRLTDTTIPDRPAPLDQIGAARTAVEAALRPVALPDVPLTTIGVAGTFTSLAAISLDLPVYDPGRVHGSRLTAARLSELVLYLASLTVDETAAIPSLDPGRARVLLAGAVIAEEAVRRAGVAEVVVSEADLLDGVALQLAGAG